VIPSLLGAACVAGTVPLHRVREGTPAVGHEWDGAAPRSASSEEIAAPEVGVGLGELADGDGGGRASSRRGRGRRSSRCGEAFVGVVVCCASTVGGASHATRTAKTMKTTQGHVDEPQQVLYPVGHIHSPFRPCPTKASAADLFAPLFAKILASWSL
jgi:hypothetical protein